MAAPTNAVTSVTNIGIREDLSNIITRVAAEETPFTSAIGSVKATNTRHEWQIETLADADETNAALEGDDVSTLDAANLTTRVSNLCQIFTKKGGVSRTQEVVNLAGRDSELARQKVLKGLEIRRDREKRFLGNYASVAESGATTRKAAGLAAWITSNDSRGAGGSDGGFNNGIVAAAGPGTQRALTESLVKGVLATAFSNGGRPKLGFMSGTHKQQFSAFTGIADIRAEVKGENMAVIIGAADVYVSDFGSITLVPHPYALTRDLVLVDQDKAKVATLDGFKSAALAKTGDNERFLMTNESTLQCSNQKAHALVADLT